MMRFSLVVPTYKPDETWLEYVEAIKSQLLVPDKVLIIDSGSSEPVLTLARQSGFQVESISANTFDHGGTRNLAANLCAEYDFVIYLTQDAILSSEFSLEKILEPFEANNVAAVCGRQLPRAGAGPIESHARLFNYLSESALRSISDVQVYGLKTAFISNSFAAYRVSALKEVGGFPEKVIFGEDMYVATKFLLADYKIAYVAEACVYHSHDYSLIQEMRRYFDMGVFHAREPWIRQVLGGAEGEGVKFVVSEFKYLLKHAFWRIPEGVVRMMFRYTGFRLGLMERFLPQWSKRLFAMNKGYFGG